MCSALREYAGDDFGRGALEAEYERHLRAAVGESPVAFAG